MPKIPTIQRAGGIERAVPGATPGGSGAAASARAFQELGGTVADLGIELANRRLSAQKDDYVFKQRLDLNEALSSTFEQLQEESDTGKTEDMEGFAQRYEDAMNEHLKLARSAAPNRESQEAFDERVLPMVQEKFIRAQSYENKQKLKIWGSSTLEGADAAARQQVLRPDHQRALSDIAAVEENVLANIDSGVATRAQGLKILKEAKRRIFDSELSGLREKGTPDQMRGRALQGLALLNQRKKKVEKNDMIEVPLEEALEAGFPEKQLKKTTKDGKTFALIPAFEDEDASAVKALRDNNLVDLLTPGEVAAHRNAFNNMLHKGKSVDVGAYRQLRSDVLAGLRSGISVDEQTLKRFNSMKLQIHGTSPDTLALENDHLRLAKIEGEMVVRAADMSRAEQEAFLDGVPARLAEESAGESSSNVFNLASRQQSQGRIARQILEVRRQQDADAAQYLLSNDERASQLKEKAMSGTPEDAAEYIKYADAQQERLGIPRDKRRFLSKDETLELSRQITVAVGQNKQAGNDVYSALQGRYGGNYPRVLKQMIEDNVAPPDIMIPGYFQSPLARESAIDLLNVEKSKAIVSNFSDRPNSTSEIRRIKTGVSEDLAPLKRAFIASKRGGHPQVMNSMMHKIFVLDIKDQMNSIPDLSISDARENTESKYLNEFVVIDEDHGSVFMPVIPEVDREISKDRVEAYIETNSKAKNLGSFDIDIGQTNSLLIFQSLGAVDETTVFSAGGAAAIPFLPEFEKLSKKEQREKFLEGVSEKAVWVTNEAQDGIILKYNTSDNPEDLTQLVKLKDTSGSFIEVKFDDIVKLRLNTPGVLNIDEVDPAKVRTKARPVDPQSLRRGRL